MRTFKPPYEVSSLKLDPELFEEQVCDGWDVATPHFPDFRPISIEEKDRLASPCLVVL